MKSTDNGRLHLTSDATSCDNDNTNDKANDTSVHGINNISNNVKKMQ